MSAIERDALWARLRESGLVAGDMPDAGAARAPWFVRVMLGIAGWIGAMFLLGFVGTGFAFVMKSAGAAFVVGAGACFAAATILRSAPKSDFVAQFGLAVSLAGQALLVVGAWRWFGRSATGIMVFVALQQALLFVLVPNFVHRVWAAWSGALAAAYAIVDAGFFAWAPAAATAAFLWVALREFELARFGSVVRAGVYGLALAAVQVAVLHGNLIGAMLLGQGMPGAKLGEWGVWLGRLASLAVLLWAAVAMLRREGSSLASGPGRVGVAGALVLGAVSIKAPGVGPAAAILIVGHANADRVLAGLGILALLGYLAHYYYTLEATLLEKSALLAAAGGALLAARFAMQRWWPASGAENAEAGRA
jgi:hypothetical protein